MSFINVHLPGHAMYKSSDLKIEKDTLLACTIEILYFFIYRQSYI